MNNELEKEFEPGEAKSEEENVPLLQQTKTTTTKSSSDVEVCLLAMVTRWYSVNVHTDACCNVLKHDVGNNSISGNTQPLSLSSDSSASLDQ